MSERKNAICPEYLLKGIYGIRNKVNDHIYVGSASKWFNDRWYDHKAQLRSNTHKNVYLQRAWNKYGEGAFEFTIIEVLDGTKEEILEVEQYYLDVFVGQEFCYNMNPKATGGMGFGRKKGFKLDYTQRQKLSVAQKARHIRNGTDKKPKNVIRPVGRPNKIDKYEKEVERLFKDGYSLRAIQNHFTDIDHVSVRNLLKAMSYDTSRKATIRYKTK